MKTTNITLVLIGILIFCMTDASAQTRFYDTPRVFHEQGFTYESIIIGRHVFLANRDSRWIGVDLVRRDGTVRGYRPRIDRNNQNQMEQLARTIVNNAFTPAERQRLRGSELWLTFYADSQTGVVDDIEFTFDKLSGFATIPVSTYRKIELELKNRIQFVPTAEGRLHNYLFFWFTIDM